MNETAYFIWENINGTASVKDILEKMLKIYNINKNVLQKDIAEQIAYFVNNDLIIKKGVQ